MEPEVSRTEEKQSRKAEMPRAVSPMIGQNPKTGDVGVSTVPVREEQAPFDVENIMERMVGTENMSRALKKVIGNQGSAGIDKMKVDELRAYLSPNWMKIKEELLNGRYRPQPVKRVEIPKPDGKGIRKLGIPIVLDRLIQQALLQVLNPIFDKDFSESSYGFRAGRSAHQAVLKAQEYVKQGKQWVVDIDLEKFFDRVNHDILMSRIARKVKDKRILLLIRRFLQAGVMDKGIVEASREGTPQGGPISPLLSNIMLDELDKELEARGHKFCRYADDCNIYAQTRLAGERIRTSITRFLAERLKLKVNEDKSAVDRPWNRKFLGYTMTNREKKLKPAAQSLERFKEKVKKIFYGAMGRKIENTIAELNPILRGWSGYFKLTEIKSIWKAIDQWIRKRFRCVIWRQGKRTYTRVQKILNRGVNPRIAEYAKGGHGPWKSASLLQMNLAYSVEFFVEKGLVSCVTMIEKLKELPRTAVYGTVRTVV